MKKVYKVIVGPDEYEDGSPSFHAYCPALKGARTHGRSREEALDNIRRLVQMVVDEIVDDGSDPPPDIEIESVHADVRV